jgi:hypothetical protein
MQDLGVAEDLVISGTRENIDILDTRNNEPARLHAVIKILSGFANEFLL